MSDYKRRGPGYFLTQPATETTHNPLQTTLQRTTGG